MSFKSGSHILLVLRCRTRIIARPGLYRDQAKEAFANIVDSCHLTLRPFVSFCALIILCFDINRSFGSMWVATQAAKTEAWVFYLLIYRILWSLGYTSFVLTHFSFGYPAVCTVEGANVAKDKPFLCRCHRLPEEARALSQQQAMTHKIAQSPRD